MTGRRALAALATSAALAVFVTQTSTVVTAGPQVSPAAIVGSPSSALYCVAGQAANVHSLGWVASGTSYTVTFESDVTLATAVTRLDLDGSRSTSAFGDPDVRFTASTPGTMALLVSGNGRPGCYRYKAVIDSTSGAIASGAAVVAPQSSPDTVAVKPWKSPIQTMAIAGLASSAKHCVAGSGVAKVHDIGRVEEGATVTINFDSDFDPVAGVTNTDLVGQRGTSYVDDDSGGSLEPQLSFTATHAGTLTLFVSGYGDGAGCYHYDADITPSASPAPFTMELVAPSLAQEINTTLEAALRAGLGTAALASTRPETFFASLLRLLLPVPVYAQAGFTANCRSGGTIRIQSGVSAPGGGRVVLSSSPAIWSGCGYPLNNRIVTFSGNMVATGTWTAGAASNPVALQGSVEVNEIGIAPIDCSSLSTQHGCHGHVGGIGTGPADTQPSPNPNSCQATLSPTAVSASSSGGSFSVSVSVGSTCPWTAGSNSGFISVTSGASGRGNGTMTFSVAANTGAARTGSVSVAGGAVNVSQLAGASTTNLTGTWTETVAGGTQTMILTQTGNQLTGRAVGAAIGGVIQTSSVTGTVSGSSVSLTESDTILVSESGASVRCQIVVRYSLTASSNSRMTGPYTASGGCSISGLPPGVPSPPLPPFSESGTAVFTK